MQITDSADLKFYMRDGLAITDLTDAPVRRLIPQMSTPY